MVETRVHLHSNFPKPNLKMCNPADTTASAVASTLPYCVFRPRFRQERLKELRHEESIVQFRFHSRTEQSLVGGMGIRRRPWHSADLILGGTHGNSESPAVSNLHTRDTFSSSLLKMPPNAAERNAIVLTRPLTTTTKRTTCALF